MEEKTIRVCTIDGCDRQLFAKGWCQSHYKRNYKFGDPLAGPEPVIRGTHCSVVGCERNEKISRGYCTIHYARFRKTGNPGLPVGQYDIELDKERFWSKVDKSAGENACWPWTGPTRGQRKGRTGNPYGDHRVRGKTRRSHRIAYEYANNVTLTPAEPVHHKCGNPSCQNPAHLQITTTRENTAEMLERNYYKNKIKELEEKLKQQTEACTCRSK